MNEENDTLDTKIESEIETGPSDEQNNNAEENDASIFRTLTFFLFLILGILIIYSYKYPLLRTWDSWGSEHGYNANGMMIFIGSCLLLFWVGKQLKNVPKKISFIGLGFVVASLLFTLAFKRGDINAMQSIGFVALIWSICFYLGGWLFARAVMFPLFLSLFSVQWGLGSSVVSLKMRIFSTKFACWFINFTGNPFDIQVIRQGTNVSMVGMPDLAFDVAAACSGLQSLMMTSVLSLLMCYLMLRTWWKRLVMILLIIPVAVLNNSLRIVLIAYCGKFFVWIEHIFHLSEGWGKKVAFGAFHEYPGVVVYGLGFLMVWLVAHYLERMPGIERDILLKKKAEKEARKAKAEQTNTETDETDETDKDDTEPEQKKVPDYSYYKILWKHTFIVVILLLIAYYVGLKVKQNIYYTKGLSALQNYPTIVTGEKGYQVRPLNYIVAIPNMIGGKTMVKMAVSEEELKQLPDDTEYFRGLYVPTNSYFNYVSAARTLLNGNFATNDYKLAEKQIKTFLKQFFNNGRWISNQFTRMAYQTIFFRSKLVGDDVDPRLRNIAMMHLLSSIARTDNDPKGIMLAIVQNNTDRHSIHAPEACFPAQGWQIDEPKPVQLSIAGNEFEVARMDAGFKQLGVRECVVYWYQCEGSDGNKVYATRNYPWLPFKTAFDLIFRGRSDRWAFVRLSTPVSKSETYDDAYKEILNFVKQLEPYIVYQNK
ncbi:MAG: EpsI family protein [Chlamydiae bacterium]|nr:MAG: EpsI family protein [Chlamydiota bacterium]